MELSPKHLHRYVNDFAGRHNIRGLGTLDQMRSIAQGMEGKRLRYKELITPRKGAGKDGLYRRLKFSTCVI